MENWTNDIENILENIRSNCVILSKEHKARYFYLKNTLRYFRLPIIIISAFNSVISVGITEFLPQTTISLLNCFFSLIVGIIGSIELYLQINNQMENSLLISKEFYLLSIDIFKILSLERQNRHQNGQKFLDDKFIIYHKLIENSNLIKTKISDKLAPIYNSNALPSINSKASNSSDEHNIII